VTTGTWTGSAIADAYISSAATWNAKGDALVANPLSQFAATTAAQLSGVLSDATISGDNTGDQVLVESIGVAVSDETTTLTTGTAKVTFRMPYAMTLTEVRATVSTAPTVSIITVDINDGGNTIMDTGTTGKKITIDVGEKTSETAATAPVLTDTALADDAEITIDIDTVGTVGAGLKVWLIGTI